MFSNQVKIHKKKYIYIPIPIPISSWTGHWWFMAVILGRWIV
jgi:Ulp1 family protease